MSKLIGKCLIVSTGQGGYNIGKKIKEESVITGKIEFKQLGVYSSETDIKDTSSLDKAITLATDGVDGCGGDRELSKELYGDSSAKGTIVQYVSEEDPAMVFITVAMSGGTGSGCAKLIAKDIAEEFEHIPVYIIAAAPEVSLDYEDVRGLGNAVDFTNEVVLEVEGDDSFVGVGICRTNLIGTHSVSSGYIASNDSIAKNLVMTLSNIQDASEYEFGSIDKADLYDRILLQMGAIGFIHSDVIGTDEAGKIAEDVLEAMVVNNRCFMLEAEKKRPNILVAARVKEENQHTIKAASNRLGDYLGSGITTRTIFSIPEDGAKESISILVTGAAVPTNWLNSVSTLISKSKQKIVDTSNRSESVAKVAQSSAFVSELGGTRKRTKKKTVATLVGQNS